MREKRILLVGDSSGERWWRPRFEGNVGTTSAASYMCLMDQRLTTTVPRPETSGDRSKGMFVKADFRYEPDRDVYRCPAGNELTYRYTREEGGLQVRRYWINDCQHCPLQPRCTSGKERRITRWEHEHLVDEMRQRLSRDPDPMTLRRCTAEHPIGTIKAWMGATHFQMRRLKNVRTGMALHVLAYNIRATLAVRDPGLIDGEGSSSKLRLPTP